MSFPECIQFLKLFEKIDLYDGICQCKNMILSNISNLFISIFYLYSLHILQRKALNIIIRIKINTKVFKKGKKDPANLGLELGLIFNLGFGLVYWH